MDDYYEFWDIDEEETRREPEFADGSPQLLQQWYWYYIHNQMIDYEIVTAYPTWLAKIRAARRRRKHRW